MHYTASVIAGLLAFSSSAMAAPYNAGNSSSAGMAAGSGSVTATATLTTAKPTSTGSPLAGLSKTQQVFLSDT
jgi:hypothetical protein